MGADGGRERADHHSLHEMIQSRLVAGFCGVQVGDKLPSDRDLAAQYGVALLTINRAMKQLEQDGYVVRKRGSGTYLASHEKVVRRTGGVNGNLVIACPDYFSSEYWTRVHLAHQEALRGGMNLLELKIYEHAGPEHLLNTLRGQADLRGVLIDPVPGSLTQNVVQALDELGVPVILFSHCPWLDGVQRVASVVPDWKQSGYDRARLVLEAGHRTLAYLHNEPSGKDGGLVAQGVRQAMADAGLRPKDLICPRGPVASWEDARAAGYALTRQVWEEHRPYGFLYDSVNGVLGGLKYFWEKGVRVPQEAGIVTYGRTGNLEEYLTPPVSAVFSPVEREIEVAFRLIFSGIPCGGQEHVCPVEIIRRSSIASAI